ncbi:anti-sigma factor antagonist [Amycolatopsis pithecellobii]|uniref:Anti-sigma factor antagonist n=1 Tax=Amycolatopsis pithecellobii TaxID=664692 RepID=A0A6N7Z3A7_9PSEU|nr:anti-sigma factor antagonist [Amycolatopsis pithecellobii]MTD54484.1 anti-sigma factor antagonist [Amycolatopsis pithecellobii]
MVAAPDFLDPPGDLLRIRRELADGAVVLRVAGDVDLSTAGKLSEQLRGARDFVVPPAPVIADLDEVEFLGSAGLMALVQENEACRQRGLTLRIVSSSRLVVRAISVAGLAEVLPVLPTVQAALTMT